MPFEVEVKVVQVMIINWLKTLLKKALLKIDKDINEGVDTTPEKVYKAALDKIFEVKVK